jgi:hypothetical protein
VGRGGHCGGCCQTVHGVVRAKRACGFRVFGVLATRYCSPQSLMQQSAERERERDSDGELPAGLCGVVLQGGADHHGQLAIFWSLASVVFLSVVSFFYRGCLALKSCWNLGTKLR